MKRYGKYKDSGIDWLGEIPENWKVKRLRYLGNCQNGVSKGADYFGSGYPFINYTDVYNNIELPQELKGLAKSTDEDRISYSVKKGDIFFTRTSETVEEIGIASTCLQTIENAIFSGFLIRFRPFNSLLFTEFSKYYFRSYVREFFFVKEMNLVTRASLSQELLKKLPVILPPFEEQKAIARYLERKTSEIDKLIAQKERLIELYEEEKTAIINQAVTKGINPDVKLKPSGIDWLGDIPEHWEVTALKRLVQKITDGEHISPKFTTEGMPFLSAKDVRDGYVQMPDDKFVDYQDGLKFRKRCDPEFDDILLVSRGATVGRVAIINTDIVFCLLGSVILLKPKQNIYSQYLFYSLKNKLLQDNFLNSSQSSAQQAIYLVDVASVYLAFSPLEEQKAIANYIETECDRIDAKIAKTKRIIELQKEYRTALISEAVTGKIKVPELAT